VGGPEPGDPPASAVRELLVLLPADALAAAPGQRSRETLDLLVPAFAAIGTRVVCGDLDRVWLEDGAVHVAGSDGRTLCPETFDGALLLGFGRRESALDRLQLLALTGTRWVTSPALVLQHHAKYGGGLVQQAFPVPRTLAGSGRHLAARLRALPPADRLVKPPAGSFGDGVALLPGAPEAAAAVLEAAGERFRIVQDRVPGRELRVLIAGGRVLGTYARRPGSGPAANRARGGGAERFDGDPTLVARLEALAAELARARIGWAGVDLRGEHLLEINLVNPGGLGTLVALGDATAADRAARALLGALHEPGAAGTDAIPAEGVPP
jgi:glutathione synthase/RimK-type ligase-like ATP-grasp enzyme